MHKRRGIACVAIVGALFAHFGAAGASAADPVIAAAGDIACSSSSSNYNGGNGVSDRCRQKYTSNLIFNAGLSAVLVLGDMQYESASLSGINSSYNPTWGRVKSITRPALGNHEYKTANAAGYFDYFNGSGAATGPAGERGKGYYSFDVGTWHLIALNSSDHCTIVSCAAASAQEVWLKADLAANSSKYCTLAFWHDPRFNSGHDGNADEMKPLFQALYDANADLMLGGHAHSYERFAPQNPAGGLDNARGIRQFVVGTGGAFWTSIGTPKPNSEVRQNSTYGVLKLTLRPTGYDYQFAPEAGKTFTDSGTGTCHGGTPPPTDTIKPSIPGNVRATAGTGQVSLLWNQSTDNVGVTGYQVFRGATQVATLGSVTSYTDPNLAPGTYSYTVRAVDGAGNVSDASAAASATVADTTKPTPPTLTATASAGQVALSWQGATDNVGVTGYQLYRGATQIATLGGAVTSYTDANLAAGGYSYTVRAVDAAGLSSDASNTASATVPDTTKPTTPTLSATGSAGQVALSWTVSTDNVAVTGYEVFRGSVRIAVLGPSANSYADTGLSPGTYFYAVRSFDAANNFSISSNTASGTVPDGLKPSAPGNLTASAPTSAAVDLSWVASTDNVGVTGYRVYRDGALIASPGAAATSYSDSAVSATVTYHYVVRAIDAAGNLSDPSSDVPVTVPDTVKPSAPGNLHTTAVTSSQVDLAWNASTDNVAVTGYRVFRNDVPIADVSAATLSYSDGPITPGTYRYTVRAVDGAGNVSDASTEVTATVPDTEKPTTPQNLDATARGAFQVDLTWDASTDNVGVASYLIYRNDVHIDTVSGTDTSYTDNVLAPDLYTYYVRAVDDAGNLSDPSNTDSATVVPPDDELPTVPGNLTAALNGTDRVDLNWEESSDNVLVTGYRIYRNDELIKTIGPGSSWSDTGVPARDHEYRVRAEDAAGNLSDPSNPAGVIVPDTAPPSPPGNLTASAPDGGPVLLEWEAADDNVGVAGYEVYRDGAFIASIDPGTSYSDPVGAGTYAYHLKAMDPTGNMSQASNTANVTELAPDTEDPGPPANLQAQVAAGKVDLLWDAATDNRAVTQYEIRRDGAVVATIGAASTSWSDSNVTAPVTYEYDVRALDAAANVSLPSNTASATVPDTQKPTPPTNLTANATASQVDLTWGAAGDDVAVTQYRIYRDGAAIATIGPGTSWSDSSVTAPGYEYEVRALDAADNLSDPSNKVTATVLDAQKPTAPGTLTATAAGPNQVNLTWTASGDNIGVTGYRVYRDTAPIATIGAVTTFSDTGVAGSTTYAYEVRALDAAGNVSDPSNTAPATTPAASAVFNFSPEADARTQASAATTNYATSFLRVDGGTDPAVESLLRFTVTGAPAGSIRSAKLRVYAYSGTVDGPAVFTTNPAWNEQAINWNNRPPRTSATTDDKGAIATNSWVEYDVTSFVTSNGTYSFGLAGTSTDGVDIYSKESATLRPELVVTTGAPDTQKPTPPPTLAATVMTASRVDLSWQPAGDNVGVTGYQVLRNGNQIASLGVTTAYSDTSVAANTSYTYQVRAVDAAGNVSDPSNSAPAATPPVATVLTLSPEADARTQEANPTTNYGTAYLRVNGGSELDVETLVRFTVTGAPAGSVASAKLRLYNYNGTADGPALYPTVTSWNETAVSWNTRPARTSGTPTDDKGAIAKNTWVEYNVTPLVTGNGTYSFALATTSSDGIDFYNREAATLRPELVVTLR